MKILICTAALLSTFTMTSTEARDIEMERLERRAYESALWGQALVAGNEMIEGARRSGQKLNQVSYTSRAPNWKFQLPTPNNSSAPVHQIGGSSRLQRQGWFVKDTGEDLTYPNRYER